MSCCEESGHDVRARDPVCGMTVDPATAKHRHEYAGRSYVFCSAKCREKFAADPLHYLAPREEAPPPPQPQGQPQGTLYTCPMHPEVRQDHPGSCPL